MKNINMHERIIIVALILVACFGIAKMATDEGQHPLDDGHPYWVCLQGECFDGHGGWRKM